MTNIISILPTPELSKNLAEDLATKLVRENFTVIRVSIGNSQLTVSSIKVLIDTLNTEQEVRESVKDFDIAILDCRGVSAKELAVFLPCSDMIIGQNQDLLDDSVEYLAGLVKANIVGINLPTPEELAEKVSILYRH